MTNETSATAEKKALLEAFDNVLKSQAEQREAEQRAEERRRRARALGRPVMGVCCALVLFVGAYLWVERPEWVFQSPPLPESVAVKEASLRIGMAGIAQHLEHYRLKNGRLPVTLRAAGASDEGIDYETVGSDGWKLIGVNGPARLMLTSDEPLSRFLGNSFEVISRRGS
jgi:hypothetical protein